MSDTKPKEETSIYLQTFIQWDKAWDLNLSQETRIARLKECTGANLTWSNGDHMITGDLPKLAQMIEQLLQGAGNACTVKHIKWWEHHQQSGLQWEMVHVDTGECLVKGFTYAAYDENGKLVSTADFYP